MTFITYIVLDPRKPGRFQSPLCSTLFEPVYVGKGSHERANHVLEIFKSQKAKKHAGIMFHKWLLGMKMLGLNEVPIVRIEQESEADAFISEKLLTSFWGLKMNGGLLFNAREGGDGGWALSDYTKELLSLANRGKNNPNWGKSWTEERRQKFKETWKSKPRERKAETMMNAWAAMRRKYVLTKPSGQKIEVENLTNFCKSENLPLTTFRQALKSTGKISGKGRAVGWTIQYKD